jgi:hypothetical protein
MTWALIVATMKKWGALFGLAAATAVLLIVRLAGIQRGKKQAHLANKKGEMKLLERLEDAQRKKVATAKAEVEKVKYQNVVKAIERDAAAAERKKDADENRSGTDVLRRARTLSRRRRQRTRTPPD